MTKSTSRTRMALFAVATLAIGGAWLSTSNDAEAADHTDPPSRVGGPSNAADIADFYAWAEGGTLKVAMTFAGLTPPSADQKGVYDSDVIYGIHIDNNGDNQPNAEIWVRFGQNDLGEWGVQAVGMPGEAGPVSGPVESAIDGGNGTKLWAGLRDDPFFFDFQGFGETLQTGTLSFDGTRDSFAGTNVTAIVLEVPVAAAIGGGSSISIWATTAKMGE